MLHLAVISAALLTVVGPARAALHEVGSAGANRRGSAVAQSQLPKAPAPDARLFSNATLDPARCNYEYVDLYGAWVVRTELKLTCTTHQ
ncbi:hypothetical protein K2Z84_27220 [Candidatus Binatia bacterium]|jgi:hypothetical protein|nr:hypothetical protein [Candidatus Binatia bacterium]